MIPLGYFSLTKLRLSLAILVIDLANSILNF